jgi:hypothetical protein
MVSTCVGLRLKPNYNVSKLMVLSVSAFPLFFPNVFVATVFVAQVRFNLTRNENGIRKGKNWSELVTSFKFFFVNLIKITDFSTNFFVLSVLLTKTI